MVSRIVRVFSNTWIAPLIWYSPQKRIQELLGLDLNHGSKKILFFTRYRTYYSVLHGEKSEQEGKNPWISAWLLGIFCEFEANFCHSRIGFFHVEKISLKTGSLNHVYILLFYFIIIFSLSSVIFSCRIIVHATFSSLWSSAPDEHSASSA